MTQMYNSDCLSHSRILGEEHEQTCYDQSLFSLEKRVLACTKLMKRCSISDRDSRIKRRSTLRIERDFITISEVFSHC